MKTIEIKLSNDKAKKLEYYLRKKYPNTNKKTKLNAIVEFALLEIILEQATKEANKALKKLNEIDDHSIRGNHP